MSGLQILHDAKRVLEQLDTPCASEGFVVSLGWHDAEADCSVPSVSVGLLWNGSVWSGHAVDLDDAIALARGKIEREKERLSKEASKRAKARQKTLIERAHDEVAG